MTTQINKVLLFVFIFLSINFSIYAQYNLNPVNLSVNFLTNTESTLLNGYPSTTPVDKAINLNENFQFTEISTVNPFFGWVIASDAINITQSAYQIIVSTEKILEQNNTSILWNSGKVNSNQSTNILYNGKALNPEEVYYWHVKVWDNQGNESAFSEVSQFKTSDTLTEYYTDRHPIQKRDEHPVKIEQFSGSGHFIDFGKAAFGRLRINLYSDNGTDSVAINLGEVQNEGRIDRSPGGSRRYAQYKIRPDKGWNTYIVTISPDERNTGPTAVLMPKHIGEVTPFRYCEIENYKYPLEEKDIIRETAFYRFNDTDSYFHSSDSILNMVWDLSKYSVKATSFLGIYVDGDRERIPYEADAIINQLSHYAVSREYNMPRYTHDYLIHNPTWPTEWIMQSVLIAWEDYRYTGNLQSLAHHYDNLKAKTLISLSDEEGFISTLTGKVSPEVLNSIHFDGNLKDIVDWPHTGILGLEKEEGGETDGFVFTEVNTVVNAYHYRALTLMAQIAQLLGKESDSVYYTQQAAKLKKSFNNHLFDKKRGIYVDGLTTDHASLHANMFPLAFGLVDDKNVKSVLKFIRSRGMACSVYGSQFLLDGLYDAGEAEYALKLLSSTKERSWYNMIRSGSTISMEAWDDKYKPNQDWNHAWGAAPANLIPRKLMGIEPLAPGFEKILIKPQPGSLKSAEIKHPTIRGDVLINFINQPEKSFHLKIEIPANTTAEVYLPFFSKHQTILMDGYHVSYKREGSFSVVENVGSGARSFTVER